METYTARELIDLAEQLSKINNSVEFKDWISNNPTFLVTMVNTAFIENGMTHIREKMNAHGIIFEVACSRTEGVPIYAVIADMKCRWEVDVYNSMFQRVIGYDEIKNGLIRWNMEMDMRRTFIGRLKLFLFGPSRVVRKLTKLIYML